MSEAALDKVSFAKLGVERLPALVASEFTTLSICHLASGKREVFGLPAGALSAQDRAAFDRHFHEHPLVRFHAYQAAGFRSALPTRSRSSNSAAPRFTTTITAASASTTRSRCRSTCETACS